MVLKLLVSARNRNGKTHPARATGTSGICGIDEAGRGSVLGPLVVAGICVDDEGPLLRLGVKDSKQLTPARREGLEKKIRAVARVKVIVLQASDIDRQRDDVTLNQIEEVAFASILRGLRPAKAYLDAADVNEERFGAEVGRLARLTTEIVSKHRADSTFPTVAAASIVAKVRRDREVRRIARASELELGLQPVVRMGSGYPSDATTIAFIRTWIKERRMLPPHTRASWETSRRLIAEEKVKRLDEW